MSYKDTEEYRVRQREYGRDWYQRNKKKHQADVNRNRRRHKAIWLEYKATVSCSKCGMQHPAVIDFHHKEKHPDNRRVNELVTAGRWKAAYKEIEERCIPLCANCHRILHWDESH